MRAPYLDALRGIAVIWMILFHTAYDLNHLGFVDWNFSAGFWYAFPRVIAFTFLFCVGASLNFVHSPSINWRSLRQRSLKLGLAALAVSISTFFIFPKSWVYFGTLHCIFLGSILGALMVNHRTLGSIVMLLIMTLQYGFNYDIKWVSSLLQRHSMDFIPIYPWFWSILLGILVGPYLNRASHLQRIQVPRTLKFLGHHSLLIYLLHQPMIYGILLLIKSL